MFMPGARSTSLPFSFISLPRAWERLSTRERSQVQARAVPQGSREV